MELYGSSNVEDDCIVKENHGVCELSQMMNPDFKGKVKDNNVNGDCSVDGLVTKTKERGHFWLADYVSNKV